MGNNADIIISDLQKGDIPSYEALFGAYYSKVFGFVRKFVKNDWLAEEVAQNVFLKLWINKENLKPDSHIEAYLFSIARNEVVDHFRSKQRFAKFQFTNPIQLSEEQASQLDAQKMQQLVDQTVANMPQQRQRIFIMSRQENITNAEIAEQLGLSKRTVEKHISLALEQIRSVLGSFQFWIFVFFIFKH